MFRANLRRDRSAAARASLDGRFAAALLLLLGLATLSVAATTGAVSRDHLNRIAADRAVTVPL